MAATSCDRWSWHHRQGANDVTFLTSRAFLLDNGQPLQRKKLQILVFFLLIVDMTFPGVFFLNCIYFWKVIFSIRALPSARVCHVHFIFMCTRHEFCDLSRSRVTRGRSSDSPMDKYNVWKEKARDARALRLRCSFRVWTFWLWWFSERESKGNNLCWQNLGFARLRRIFLFSPDVILLRQMVSLIHIDRLHLAHKSLIMSSPWTAMKSKWEWQGDGSISILGRDTSRDWFSILKCTMCPWNALNLGKHLYIDLNCLRCPRGHQWTSPYVFYVAIHLLHSPLTGKLLL